MANNLQRLVPHSTVPGLITPIFQKVDFRALLGEVTRFGKLGDDILYQTTLSAINTPTVVGQQWRGDVDKSTYSLSQLSFPYYTIEAKLEMGPDEEAKFASVVPGVGLKQFLSNLCAQGINQREHYACLFGFDTTAGQGIIKNGAYYDNLGNDSGGHSTIQTYIVIELLATLAAQARTVMDASYGMAKPVKIIAPSNMINYLKSTIVPLASYQMPGGGVDSIGGAYSRMIGEWLGVGKVEFIADNAMAGKGGSSKDLISFVAPGLSDQEAKADPNTNLVADELPENMRNTMMDMIEGKKEFVNPPINGIKSSLFSLTTTSGAVIRPEAVRTLEYTF